MYLPEEEAGVSGHGRRITWALLLGALMLALSACGGSAARKASASAAATAFEKALSGGDRTALCAALAPETRGEVEDSAKKACADAIVEQVLSAGGPIHGVDVHGRQARVVLASDTLFLSEFRDGWKITAAGCLPRPGRPYQCSVKGS